jgi:ribosomal protein S18 acetylase RimI-like enzyme
VFHGVHQEFLCAAEQQGSQDIHDVRIEASAENDTAISFYKRMGFTPYNLILEGRLG